MIITRFTARGHSGRAERLSRSPLALQLLCPISPKKHQGLRLLRSPKLCVGRRQGSQKDVILETIISFASALSPKRTLRRHSVFREWGTGAPPQLGFEPFGQMEDSEVLHSAQFLLCRVPPALLVPTVTPSQVVRVGRGPEITSALLGKPWLYREAGLQPCLPPWVLLPLLSQTLFFLSEKINTKKL